MLINEFEERQFPEKLFYFLKCEECFKMWNKEAASKQNVPPATLTFEASQFFAIEGKVERDKAQKALQFFESAMTLSFLLLRSSVVAALSLLLLVSILPAAQSQSVTPLSNTCTPDAPYIVPTTTSGLGYWGDSPSPASSSNCVNVNRACIGNVVTGVTNVTSFAFNLYADCGTTAPEHAVGVILDWANTSAGVLHTSDEIPSSSFPATTPLGTVFTTISVNFSTTVTLDAACVLIFNDKTFPYTNLLFFSYQ